MEREDAAADGGLPDDSNAGPADEEPTGGGRFSFGMGQQVSTDELDGCVNACAQGLMCCLMIAVLILLRWRQVGLIRIAFGMARKSYLDSALPPFSFDLCVLCLVLLHIEALTACVPARLFCSRLEQLTCADVTCCMDSEPDALFSCTCQSASSKLVDCVAPCSIACSNVVMHFLWGNSQGPPSLSPAGTSWRQCFTGTGHVDSGGGCRPQLASTSDAEGLCAYGHALLAGTAGDSSQGVSLKG